MPSLVRCICSVVRARDAVSCERGVSLSCLGDASLPSTALPEGGIHAQSTLFNRLAVISVLEQFISPDAYLMPEW